MLPISSIIEQISSFVSSSVMQDIFVKNNFTPIPAISQAYQALGVYLYIGIQRKTKQQYTLKPHPNSTIHSHYTFHTPPYPNPKTSPLPNPTKPPSANQLQHPIADRQPQFQYRTPIVLNPRITRLKPPRRYLQPWLELVGWDELCGTVDAVAVLVVRS